jgi:hypothetical protein
MNIVVYGNDSSFYSGYSSLMDGMKAWNYEVSIRTTLCRLI